MRRALPPRIERGRIAGDPSWGPYGKFEIFGPCYHKLRIIASGADEDDVIAEGWEHVSVSTISKRPPNWAEMCFVKDLFWEDEEAVIQFHPPKSQYVNNHPYVLHLWRPKDGRVPLPPSILVGVKSLGILTPEDAQVLERAVGR